jgi:septal ring factor EnvC (AmiA/AmiB activator)
MTKSEEIETLRKFAKNAARSAATWPICLNTSSPSSSRTSGPIFITLPELHTIEQDIRALQEQVADEQRILAAKREEIKTLTALVLQLERQKAGMLHSLDQLRQQITRLLSCNP